MKFAKKKKEKKLKLILTNGCINNYIYIQVYNKNEKATQKK